jgi:hypothetical protein
MCAIKYFLACNNNSDIIQNGRVRRDGKQEVKEKGKTNKQTSRIKQNKESNKKFQRYKQGALVY